MQTCPKCKKSELEAVELAELDSDTYTDTYRCPRCGCRVTLAYRLASVSIDGTPSATDDQGTM
jgi:DNA-directed RNA polymerase subunit RPC12/RpoP